MASRLNRRLINLAATYRDPSDFVQVGPAYVEPFRLLQVMAATGGPRVHFARFGGIQCDVFWGFEVMAPQRSFNNSRTGVPRVAGLVF